MPLPPESGDSHSPYRDQLITVEVATTAVLVIGALHLLAAVAAPALLWNLEAIRRASVVVFVVLEVALGLISVAAFRAGRRDRGDLFDRLTTWETALVAVNFGALPWAGDELASSAPGKYLLAVTLVTVSAIAATNAAMLPTRRRSLLTMVGVVGLSNVVAFLVAGEWFFAAFSIVWPAATLAYSRLLLDSRQKLLRERTESLDSARHDDLTGLLNRNAFMSELGVALDADRPAVLMLLDLDGFKAVNDGFGHRAGDLVLRAAADRTSAALPTGSVVGRMGGDELAAVIPSDQADLDSTLDRVIEQVGEPIEIGGSDIYVAASIGCTDLDSTASAATLMAQADAAMYEAKNSSTSSWTRFNDRMRSELDRSLELRQLFRNAVRGGQIDFHAQPIVRAADRTPLAVELLARWCSDEATEITPDEFNRLADETGLIVELDRLALGAAGELLARWRGHPVLGELVVKANISPLHLHNLELGRSITELIAAEDVTRLGLEFVESKLIGASQPLNELLRDLKAMGVTISIDDFGTGYSSFQYLRDLALSELKIDRSFVVGVDRDVISQGLVRAIVDLASTLGLTTVAEGVETPGELAEVAALGVIAVQGYITGHPMPFDEVTAALSTK